MIKIPVIEQSPKYVRVLKPCDSDNSSSCFEYKHKTETLFKVDYINKTIYEKKFDCCPGWANVDNIPGCTKSILFVVINIIRNFY
jgi:hypothetical protein